MILAAAADLIFAARIQAAADQAGAPVTVLTRGDVLASVRSLNPTLIVLDLDARWFRAPEVIRALKEDEATKGTQIVAYVSHVREDMIGAARAAGADRVLARSAFVQKLPELLRP